MNDLAYIVAPIRRDGKPPALTKGVAPPQGSDVCVWFDPDMARLVAEGLNRDLERETWAVYSITVLPAVRLAPVGERRG
jgi:hypothetical protein